MGNFETGRKKTLKDVCSVIVGNMYFAISSRYHPITKEHETLVREWILVRVSLVFQTDESIHLNVGAADVCQGGPVASWTKGYFHDSC